MTTSVLDGTDGTHHHQPPHEVLEEVVIRFAGDSGDGMQLTGDQFTTTSALIGNDLATLPDFPAEIRAPAGTLPGVSGFQVHIADHEIYTPGDVLDVLVAMNPAALKVNVGDLKANGVLVVNADEFTEQNLKKAAYASSPLEDGSLDRFRVVKVDLTTLTRHALEGLGLDAKTQDRCKNFFALGMMYWLFNRPEESTLRWIERKFAGKPQLVEANSRALKAGRAYCEATEIFQVTYEVHPAPLKPGVYRSVNGNQALALGLVAAAQQSGLALFLGAYPITPASDLLHELAPHKNFGVVTFQAEDEIAAVCAAIGAAYGGSLGVCSTSGPGMCLKAEAIGLATAVELPLVICDIQRAGPSTGMPTKTEQADLLMAMFGRHGDSSIPVLAASSPADCFDTALEACRVATRYMTPVILLSDGYIANSSEPWLLPSVPALPDLRPTFRTDPAGFLPYLRDEATLARPWAVPGTPGLEHRVGGLEKADRTGNISYDAQNHERMVHLRADKVAGIAREVPDVEVVGDPAGGRLLILGWGSTKGPITGAVEKLRADGLSVSRAHLRYLNPFPRNLGEVLSRFETVLVPEMNLGQLALLLRAKYLEDVVSYSKVQGKPFTRQNIVDRARAILEGRRHGR